MGLIYGTGLAAIGEGLIQVADKWTRKGLNLLGVEDAGEPPVAPPSPANRDAIDAAMKKLDQID